VARCSTRLGGADSARGEWRVNIEPRWSRDGRRVAFTSLRLRGRRHASPWTQALAVRRHSDRRGSRRRAAALAYSRFDQYLSPTGARRTRADREATGAHLGIGRVSRIPASAGATRIHGEETTGAPAGLSPDGRDWPMPRISDGSAPALGQRPRRAAIRSSSPTAISTRRRPAVPSGDWLTSPTRVAIPLWVVEVPGGMPADEASRRTYCPVSFGRRGRLGRRPLRQNLGARWGTALRTGRCPAPRGRRLRRVSAASSTPLPYGGAPSHCASGTARGSLAARVAVTPRSG
jgi:hypothetical protein